MDKVTAAMVLTSLSTSPLVRSPPVKVNGESLKRPKDGSEPQQTLTSRRSSVRVQLIARLEKKHSFEVRLRSVFKETAIKFML